MVEGLQTTARAEETLPPMEREPHRAGQLWSLFVRNRLALVSAIVLLAVVAVALLAPLLPLANPNVIDTAHRLEGPHASPGYALGSDHIGRDMLSRLVWGGRISLLMGILSALLALTVGGVLGLIAGYGNERVDRIVMFCVDVVMAFPFILLGIALVAVLGPGLLNAMLAIAIVGVPTYVRVVRASVLSVKATEYVEAAQALGGRDAGIAGRHIIPNIFAPILVMFSLDIGTKIIQTAGLSFLGLGTQPPTADWGSMLADGRNYLAIAPHVATLPGLMIFGVALAFNLVGDGLRDALDPRLRI